MYGLLIAFPIPIIFALLLNQVRNKRMRKAIQTISYAWQLDDENMMYVPVDDEGRQIVQGFESYTAARMNTTPTRGSMIVLNEYYDKYVKLDVNSIHANQQVNGKAEILEEYDTIPKVLMTNEELNTLAQIQPTISDIVNRYVTDWVLNGTSEESWNQYKEELQAAGVEQLVDLYQQAVDRASVK